MRALETRDHAKAVWTDADRAWASRAAAEVVGERADARPSLPAAHGLRWNGSANATRRCRAPCVLCTGGRGSRGRSSPARSRLAWRLIALAVRSASICWRLRSLRCLSGISSCMRCSPAGSSSAYGNTGDPGPVRRLVMRVASRTGVGLGGGSSVPGGASEIIGASVAALTADWLRLAAPLYAMRAARILHFAAAALGAGRDRGPVRARARLRIPRDMGKHVSRCGQRSAGCSRLLLAPGSCVSGIADA